MALAIVCLGTWVWAHCTRHVLLCIGEAGHGMPRCMPAVLTGRRGVGSAAYKGCCVEKAGHGLKE